MMLHPYSKARTHPAILTPLLTKNVMGLVPKALFARYHNGQILYVSNSTMQVIHLIDSLLGITPLDLIILYSFLATRTVIHIDLTREHITFRLPRNPLKPPFQNDH